MVKFLIVDDDPACRRLLKDFLSPYGHCDLAFDGREAIAAVRIALDNQSPYDLICLDIMMPEINGHEVLDAVRQLEDQRRIHGCDGAKVVMTTAMRDSEHCIRAFRQGCESYLTKPLQEQQLLDQVRSLLGELHAQTPQAVPQAGPAPAVPTASAARPAQPAAPRRGRYLVVDDDRVCRELLSDILASYGDCDFAYNGAEAIDAARLAIEDGTPYDLICLDIMMPRVSGHDTLRAVRQIEAEHGICGTDGVKVIMTTALRDSKHCVQAFREGCESYVTKPIHEADLVAKMRELSLLPD